MRFSSHIPATLRRAPRGGGIFNLIALIATIILTGGLGVGILALIDASSCTVNVFWGCGSNTGTNINGSTLCVSPPNSCGQRNVGTLQTSYTCPSGYVLPAPFTTCSKGGCSASGSTCYEVDSSGNYVKTAQVCGKGGCSSNYITIPATPVQSCSATAPANTSCTNSPCTSPPNACGQTSTGTIQAGGGCSATTPSNSSCPQPKIDKFFPNPQTIGGGGGGVGGGGGGTTTLFWQTTNTTDCNISGDNGFSYTGGLGSSVGSTTVTGITQTTTFTLTCQNGVGGNTVSLSTKVIVDPHYKEI